MKKSLSWEIRLSGNCQNTVKNVNKNWNYLVPRSFAHFILTFVNIRISFKFIVPKKSHWGGSIIYVCNYVPFPDAPLVVYIISRSLTWFVFHLSCGSCWISQLDLIKCNLRFNYVGFVLTIYNQHLSDAERCISFPLILVFQFFLMQNVLCF